MSPAQLALMERASQLLQKMKTEGLSEADFKKLQRIQAQCPHHDDPLSFLHNGEDCEVCGEKLMV
ncbi:MAG: hypothetical protein WA051_02630 [Minisyncoccia bacterium]